MAALFGLKCKSQYLHFRVGFPFLFIVCVCVCVLLVKNHILKNVFTDVAHKNNT
jgi:hypothetical protein